MRRRTFVVSAAGAALATTTPTAAPALAADPLPPALGARFPGMERGYWRGGRPRSGFHRHLDTLRAYGVGLVRVDVARPGSERRRGGQRAGHPYHQRLSTLLDAAAARGVDVLLTLHDSPAWARPGASSRDASARFSDGPGAITSWARWMAATYGDRVYAWEVRHEPDLPGTTGVHRPAERAARCAALLTACSAGLRSGHPSAVVVLGGPRRADHRFVRDVYAAGARDHFDVLALRPGPPGGVQDVTDFPAVAEAMRAYRDGDKPVWWTELGSGEPARAFELARTHCPQVRLGVVDPGASVPQWAGLRDYFSRHDGHRDPLGVRPTA
ncbi:cellulase family glycosylhydrolase [Streptomyces sp. ISL-11]|uniref:cellulase family glycosylhydrolase n=1 Tax=Streptomyces sp. ISL-11 TaxID=2819174 RepID=UPI001BE53D9E|nr:cellulase family glycosylhydrolase [Streptomyces sp. ISL-11]MBT2386062.1 cellulase family glycosylhydrolase [Streptomyces sp. ISL-11]